MSLLRRGVESRAIGSVPWDQGGDRPSLSGASIESALRLMPLYAAVSGIAEDVATTPLHAYTDRDGVRVRLPRQPGIVTDPGVNVGRIAWRQQAVASLLLRGNAFGLIVDLEANGWASKIQWLHPDQMQVDESKGSPRYVYAGRELAATSVLHIPAFVLPGSVVGLSPVQLFRLQLSRGLSAEEYAHAFYQRGIMPPGVLRNGKRILKPGEGEVARERFRASVAGRDVFVTGNDWEWQALSVPKDDAVFLDTIKAGATQIAAIYRVDPEDVGGAVESSSLKYSTLEMNELKRVRRALMPWFIRLEEAVSSVLPRGQYVKFNTDALARADLKTRMEAHAIALRLGLETNSEGRALEDRPPLTAAERDEWQNDYVRRQQDGTVIEGGVDA